MKYDFSKLNKIKKYSDFFDMCEVKEDRGVLIYK